MQKQKKILAFWKRAAFTSNPKGFTLIELLLVMAVITILMAAAMSSMANSRYTSSFLSADEKLTSFLRTARTYAITGKSVTDYTDFDGDGDNTDQVTPVGFGVAFVGPRVVLFADLHADKTTGLPAEKSFQDPGVNKIGQHSDDSGASTDLVLDEFTLDTTLVNIQQPDAVSPDSPITAVMYSPIFADTTFQGNLPAAKTYLNLQVYSTVISNMKHCFWIHPIAGNPEPRTCS